MTYDTEFDFDADISVKEPASLILHIDKLTISFVSVLASARGDVVTWRLNFAVGAAIIAITVVINTFLQGGFDLNYIIQEFLGIYFFYFKRFELEEDDQLIYARLTPGYNISWA